MTKSTDDIDDELRSYAAELFGRKPAAESPDPPTEGNHSPREGNNPTATPTDFPSFVAALFERAHND